MFAKSEFWEENLNCALYDVCLSESQGPLRILTLLIRKRGTEWELLMRSPQVSPDSQGASLYEIKEDERVWDISYERSC